jgi:hydrogenase maturation protein HypF
MDFNDQDISDTTAQLRRLRVEIHGAVQGVGFRPFAYRLATELSLAGWVINDTAGVFIEVEGPEQRLAEFLRRLPDERPPRALIQSLDATWLAPVGYEGFEIRHSDGQGSKTVLVLPDIAICPDCLREISDPHDRRYGYPFTNCTNCGPRFSIIQALPYDRPNTTMRRFVLCPACQAEYDSPLDRRFHAQPSACALCGPRLAVWSRQDNAAAEVSGVTFQGSGVTSHVSSVTCLAENDAALRLAADALCQGQIVAVKGLGGFHLMVDAGNTEAIARLRQRKQRYEKPLALMVRDLTAARRLVQVDEQAAALLTSAEAPIVLLPRRADAPAASNVAPGNPTLGVMLAYTPLHHLLLDEVARSETGHSGEARSETGHSSEGTVRSIEALVATSGNLSDEPICIDEQEAAARLGQIADLFLVHDRPIERHVDDSLAWIVEGKARLLRRARGYAPLPVLLAQPAPTILAVGAHLKNTVALSVGRQVFISQHIGDLETVEALAAFERVITDFLRLYEAEPAAIAYDMHPDYLSTRWAVEAVDKETSRQGHKAGVPVQHHHAHLAACLAENGVSGPALGVTWDGTGYGLDGTIWGGEFLLGDAADFARVAHLRPFRLPGGDAAVKGPRRVALALLWELYGEAALSMDDLAPIRALPASERQVLSQMLRRGLSAPITTSAGRLFAGVAALIGLHQQVSFEGQAAMALEYAVDAREEGAYPISIGKEGNQREMRESQGTEDATSGKLLPFPSASPPFSSFPSVSPPLLFDWQPMLEALLSDLRAGVSSGIMAARFHHALVDGIVRVAELVGQPRVALSGGCFQNRLLLERTAHRLRQTGFQVLLHRQVPPNDGGISLGQVAVAAARLTGVRQTVTGDR